MSDKESPATEVMGRKHCVFQSLGSWRFIATTGLILNDDFELWDNEYNVIWTAEIIGITFR